MPLEIRERELPGVGVRYEMDLDTDTTIAAIIHTTGRRDIYYREDPEADYTPIVELTDSQARALGILLVGAYYQPVPAQVGDVSPTDERTKWYQIAENAPAVDERIGSLRSQGSLDDEILAIVRRGERISHPDEDVRLQVDDRIVAIGDQETHKQLAQLLHGTE